MTEPLIDSMPPTPSPFDALIPRSVITVGEDRPHRRLAIWRERATGRPVSVREETRLRELGALHVLAGALACDVTMRKAIRDLRLPSRGCRPSGLVPVIHRNVGFPDTQTIDQKREARRLAVDDAAAALELGGSAEIPNNVELLARNYLRWEGRPRRVLVAFIERALDCRSENPGACLYSAASTVVPREQKSAWRPKRWRAAHHYQRGAEVLVAVGSGRCAEPGCEQSVSATPHRYCADHGDDVFSQPGALARADREAVSRLLNAVGDALGVK